MFSEKQKEVLTYLENPKYTHVTECFYGGAAGGGKSFLGCHWQIARRIQYRGTRGCIGRSVLKNLKLTTFRTFIDVWNKWYANNPYGIKYTLNSQTNVIHFSNGSEIILKDLATLPSDPDFTSLGSLEITDAFIDEAPEISQKAFEILQSRIRYKLIDNTPKILLSGNPQNNWIKHRYVKTKDGKPVALKEYQKYVKATVYDNPNSDFRESYIRQLEKINPYDRERLLNGDWDVINSENKFFYAFKDQNYIDASQGVLDASQGVYLDLAFDFNASPTTLLVGQNNFKEYKVFDLFLTDTNTIKGASPLEAACRLFKKKYIENGNAVPYRIRVTGDASGKAGSADRQANYSFYTTIQRELQLNINQIFVRQANLSHVTSGQMINHAFNSLGAKFLLSIPQLRDEISIAYPDSDNTLNEAKKKFGLHVLDAFRYMCDFWFAYQGGFYTDPKKIMQRIDLIAKL